MVLVGVVVVVFYRRDMCEDCYDFLDGVFILGWVVVFRGVD